MTVNTKKKILLWIIIAVTGLFLAAIISLCIYIRPMADDLFFTSAYGAQKFFSNAAYIFTINGRITSLAIYLFGYALPGFLFMVPLLSYALVGIGIYLLIKSILKDTVQQSIIFLSIALTLITLVGATIMTPAINSSVFWFSAAPVHVWSYGLYFILLSIIVNAYKSKIKPHLWTYAIFGLFTIIIGMMNELVSILLIVTSIFVLLVSSKEGHHNLRQRGIIGLVTSSLSFIVMCFAPGTANRRLTLEGLSEHSIMDNIITLPNEIIKSIFHLVPTTVPNLQFSIVIITIATVLSVLFIKKIPLKKLGLITLSIITTFITIHILNVAIIWVTGCGQLSTRSYFLIALSLSIMCISIGIYFGQIIERIAPYKRGLLSGFIIAISLIILLNAHFYVPYALRVRSRFKNYSIAWEKRDKYIKDAIQQDNCNITVPVITFQGIFDIKVNKVTWANSAIQTYYTPKDNARYWDNCKITASKQ